MRQAAGLCYGPTFGLSKMNARRLALDLQIFLVNSASDTAYFGGPVNPSYSLDYLRNCLDLLVTGQNSPKCQPHSVQNLTHFANKCLNFSN